jgi:hypothetical protein
MKSHLHREEGRKPTNLGGLRCEPLAWESSLIHNKSANPATPPPQQPSSETHQNPPEQPLLAQRKTPGAKLSSEDGEVEELDGDLDDDGWEEESEDDS